MSVEKLTFETAVALGKRICPPEWELFKVDDLLSVNGISEELGIHLSTIKRWIAEAVFVEEVPAKILISEDFEEEDGWEPLEVLAFYVQARLSCMWRRSWDRHACAPEEVA